MRTWSTLFITIFVVVLIIVGVVSHRRSLTIPIIEPETFEQCALIYPVMESFPRQCATPQGLHFVEELKSTTTPKSATTTSNTSATSTEILIDVE